jgi:signal peptidase I
MIKLLRENRRFVIGVFLLFVFRASFADHYLVPSGSMEPTLLPGDRVVVDKRAYGLRIPLTEVKLTDGKAVARGDIVVFDEPETGTRLIKRVVAIGGDVVEVRAGHVFIDGRLQPADPANLQFGGGPDVPPILVPAGQVLALGDSRGNSRDGRWFGFVPVSALYAKALRVYYRSEQGLVWLPL